MVKVLWMQSFVASKTVRQHRYRARKRDEKAKTDRYFRQGDHNMSHGALTVSFHLLDVPYMENRLHSLKRDMTSFSAKPTQENKHTLDASDNCGDETKTYRDQSFESDEKSCEGSGLHLPQSGQQQRATHIPEMILQGHLNESHGHRSVIFHAPTSISRMNGDHRVSTLLNHGRAKSHYDIMTHCLKNRDGNGGIEPESALKLT